MNARPIVLYILSSPHGGSTLCSLVMGRHPLAVNLGEASYIPKYLALGELCTCGVQLAECEHWSHIFERLAVDTGFDLRTSPYGLYMGDAWKSGNGSGLIDEHRQTRLRNIARKLRAAVDTTALMTTPRWLGMSATTLPSTLMGVRNTIALYEAAAATDHRELIIDASKRIRKGLHLYLQRPDHVRILHIIRDGRGVVASHKSYMSVHEASKRWYQYHKRTRRLLGRWVPAKHRMNIKYENFTSDPKAMLGTIFDWLKLPYSDECLSFGNGMKIHSAGGNNNARFSMADGIRQADDRWKTTLKPSDLKVFDSVSGRLNRELGYE